MSRYSLSLLFLFVTGITISLAHAQTAVKPFKLGTFERQGKTFVGIVLDDSLVIDFALANSALPGQGTAVTPPTDMKDLIARYDSGLRTRIIQIVESVSNFPANNRPAYLYNTGTVKTLPPVMYPTVIMNAALNYTEHALEMVDVRDAGGDAATPPGLAAPGSGRPPGIWEPSADDRRWNPYIFLKSPTAVIAHNETIRIPRGRVEIDWECELGIVVGQTAKHVSASDAGDYIFGYTLEMDVSDRGSRGDSRYGSDWLAGKSHDTFAPLGPYIVPKEFISDPQDLRITFALNGEVMQDSTTSLMIHNVFELTAYASNILTLRPGDIVATGTPAGVGSARNPPIYLQDGDKTVCTYEGIGTLENSVTNPYK
jgi:2-keto-4-pentenoate hydratase/2-oxohepta-3-ene-1,7-dioic acid hydratase in catechol pathway